MTQSSLKKSLSLMSLLALTGAPLVGCDGQSLEAGVGTESQLGTTEQAVSYGGSDYLFVTTPKTWHVARTHCQMLGYDLVTINDRNEEDFLEVQEKARGMKNVWTALNDLGSEGSFKGPQGEPASYFNWHPGEPSNANGIEHCVTDRFHYSTTIASEQWNDDNCDTPFPFICERPAESTTNRGSFPFAVQSTADATTNTANRQLSLVAGQLFTAGTCGLHGASGNKGDTYLRLFNAAGQEVASNDDAEGPCGFLSNFSIVIPATGTYTLRAGCFAHKACSGTVAYNY
ncbi:C-type lectin domain-containing protein [Pyxidicoccus fallax]|uniref:C-type lectin domain-containing protein n=1 Tax=Pyxidicoccus fallax TaxID=394095 RepID=A0A848LBP7_9BACT|nr:C-type lectin domain-containing protein [Pyxidicoccus fallax]NMO14123.1 C-type lectin domain-containing protein [Pyxidicoccus fallax]NPC78008.1 C-type lectin domain-containing protein [Pyxidicoccus fallax]